MVGGRCRCLFARLFRLFSIYGTSGNREMPRICVPTANPPRCFYNRLGYAGLRLIAVSKKALRKLNKESRPRAGRWRCCTSARRQPGRDLHKHVSLGPARSDTNLPSNPQSAPAPSPYKTGPKLAMRRRGHQTCHSSLSLRLISTPRRISRVFRVRELASGQEQLIERTPPLNPPRR